MLPMEYFANVCQVTIEQENNLFVVNEEDGVIVVDTGVDSPDIEEVIAHIKDSNKPLKAIVITHCHDDHLGGLKAIKTAFPEAPLFFPKREYELVTDHLLLPDEEAIPLKGGIPDSLPVEPDFFIEEGDKIGELMVLFTPGHTPGHITLFHPTHRYLLVGDVMQTLGGAAICGVYREAFAKPAFLNWDLERSIQVVERYLALEPLYIGTGHGEVMHDALSMLPQTIEEAKQVLYEKQHA